jgi:sulfur carrier protein
VTLTVNGEPTEVADGATVASLVGAVAPSPKGVAVAVNGDIVPRSAWADTPVASGDTVEILAAAQGG